MQKSVRNSTVKYKTERGVLQKSVHSSIVKHQTERGVLQKSVRSNSLKNKTERGVLQKSVRRPPTVSASIHGEGKRTGMISHVNVCRITLDDKH